MFNKVLLTPYTPLAFPNQEQPLLPPPDLINGKEHYKIEKVLDSREWMIRGKHGGPPWRVTDYFIKWKGYGPESNSWVWEDNMDVDKLIKEFLADHINKLTMWPTTWQSYTDPRTGKKMWYDEDKLWEWLGGHNDSSMDTKLPFRLDKIP